MPVLIIFMCYREFDSDKVFLAFGNIFNNSLSKEDFDSLSNYYGNTDDGDISDTDLGTSYSEYFSNVLDSARLNLSSTVAGDLIESMTGDREQSGAGADNLFGELPGSFGQNFFPLDNSSKTAILPKTTTNLSTIGTTVASNLPGCSYSINSDGFIAFMFFNFIAMFVIPFLVSSIQICKNNHVAYCNYVCDTATT